MIDHVQLILVAAAYLLGSIPSAVWIGKAFYGIDVRQHGSGNAGTTNTIRVLGLRAGIPVLLLDVVKGCFAVRLAYLLNYPPEGSNAFVNFQLLLSLAAVIGHIFPVFAGFRGGKGVATLLGIVLAIHWQAALLTFLIFIIILLVSRYVSLSSIVAGISFPILVLVFFKSEAPSMAVFSISISVLLLLTHQKNIERLLRRKESKTSLFRRRKKNQDSQ